MGGWTEMVKESGVSCMPGSALLIIHIIPSNGYTCFFALPPRLLPALSKKMTQYGGWNNPSGLKLITSVSVYRTCFHRYLPALPGRRPSLPTVTSSAPSESPISFLV